MQRPRILLTILLLFAVVGVTADHASAQSKRDRDRAKALQTEGDRAYQQKNYQLAADKYGDAIKLVANSPQAHYFKGSAHYMLKEERAKRVTELEKQKASEPASASTLDPQIAEQNDEIERQLALALNHFTFALNQGYKAADVHRQRAYVYYDLEEYDNAIADIEKVLSSTPNDLALIKTAGAIRMSEKKYPEALAYYKRAVAVSPRDGDAHYSIALIENVRGNVAEQAAAAQIAADNGTSYPGEAFFLVGDARERERNNAAAIEAFRRAIFAKPDIYDAYRRLALLYRKEGRLNESIEISKQALRVFPNDGATYTDLSYYYSLADRPNDAVDAARAGITLLPNEHMPHTNLCRALNETKKHDQAVNACNAALRLKPNDGETLFYLGRAYDFLGRSADATRMYTQSVTGLSAFTRENPDDHDGWYLLGNALFADNQRDNAVEAYERCLAISPRFAKARFNLGVIQTRRNNKAAANAQYEALRQLDPKLAEMLKSEIDRM